MVEKRYSGSTHYGNSSTFLKSLDEIPGTIRTNIDRFLHEALGDLLANIKFSHGQVVDLKQYFKDDTTVYKYEWVVPKYDLHFIFQDSIMGIETYYLKIGVDEYGQIIAANWPRHGYANRKTFLSRDEIEQYALKEAEQKGYNIKSYTVDFEYNIEHRKLCWIFMFPRGVKPNYQEYDTLEIDAKKLELISNHITSIRSVN